jgi:hypothetical protein
VGISWRYGSFQHPMRHLRERLRAQSPGQTLSSWEGWRLEAKDGSEETRAAISQCRRKETQVRVSTTATSRVG